METIEIKDAISIVDAVNKVLKMAEQVNHPVVRKYDGFFIDSKYGYEKNIKLYFAHKEQIYNNINWEQRRYEIAKEMLCAIYLDDGSERRDLESGFFECCAKEAIRFADALIEELKRKEVQND
jgi:hypothetical protein